jgi:DNA-binding LytR/AlgR family response regulator
VPPSVLDSGRALDLLFTDIVIPGGFNGRELAARARTQRPGLPILLASGYAELALADANAESFEIMTKPYSKRTLAHACTRC